MTVLISQQPGNIHHPMPAAGQLRRQVGRLFFALPASLQTESSCLGNFRILQHSACLFGPASADQLSTTSTQGVNISHRLTGFWHAVERSGPMWMPARTIVIKRQLTGLPVKLREQRPELSGYRCGWMSATVPNQPGPRNHLSVGVRSTPSTDTRSRHRSTPAPARVPVQPQ